MLDILQLFSIWDLMSLETIPDSDLNYSTTISLSLKS